MGRQSIPLSEFKKEWLVFNVLILTNKLTEIIMSTVLEGVELLIGTAKSRGYASSFRVGEETNPLFLNGVLDREYDCVLADNTLCGLFDYKVAIANWVRVIKSGGFLDITIPEHWSNENNFVQYLKKLGMEKIDVTNTDQNVNIIARKPNRLGKSVLLKNSIGAGDRVNILPILRFLDHLGYDVHAHSHMNGEQNIILNTKVAAPIGSIGTFRGYDFTLYSKQIENKIPANIAMVEDLKNIMNIEYKDIFFPSLAFSAREAAQIRSKRKEKIASVLGWSNVYQKVLSPDILKSVIKYLKNKGYKVTTAHPKIPTPDGIVFDWDDIFRGCDFWESYEFFDRRWLVDMASSQLLVSYDGGPMLVGLGSYIPTFVFLAMADSSVLNLYPQWLQESIISTVHCAPCGRSGTWPKGASGPSIPNCDSYDSPCGRNYNLEGVFKKLDTLVIVNQEF